MSDTAIFLLVFSGVMFSCLFTLLLWKKHYDVLRELRRDVNLYLDCFVNESDDLRVIQNGTSDEIIKLKEELASIKSRFEADGNMRLKSYKNLENRINNLVGLADNLYEYDKRISKLENRYEDS